jgi:phage gpG-like protein
MESSSVDLREDVLDKIKDPRARNEALRKIGEVILKEARDSFRSESFQGTDWDPRYPNQKGSGEINVAGAVKDLNESPVIKSRRFSSTPALIDTGALLRSLNGMDAIRITDSKVVRVGSKLPYANIVQTGGKGNTIGFSGDFKQNLYIAKEEAEGGENEEAVNRLSYLFSQEEYTADLNPRPYLGMTSKTKRKIRTILKKALKGKV